MQQTDSLGYFSERHYKSEENTQCSMTSCAIFNSNHYNSTKPHLTFTKFLMKVNLFKK